MFVRIIATPPGEAPEDVRRAWISMELPLVAGEVGPRTIPTNGVLTGPRSFLGKLWKLLTKQFVYSRGYVIDARQALVLLAAKAPSAARWWRECAPHCWQPGHKFVFAAEVCAEVSNRESSRHNSSPGQTSSEEFYSACPTDVIHKSGPVYRPSRGTDI